MSTLAAKPLRQAKAKSARATGASLLVQLSDGREITVPFAKARWLAWLARATPKQRANWTIEPGGYAIYWPDLDDGVKYATSWTRRR